MRITVDLDDSLHRQLRRRASDDRISMREVIHAALRAYLAPGKPYRLRWRTERGRMRPGVNLNSRDALFDLMDRK